MSASLPRRAAYALVLAGVVASVLTSLLGVRLLDEGYILYNSWQIAEGRVPYRDLFLLYPPGMFALLAGAIRVAGVAWAGVVGRVTVLIASGLTAWLAYLLTRRLASRTSAFAVAGLALLWGVPVYNTPFPNVYCLPLLLGAVALVCAGSADRPIGRLIAAGALVGLSATFKQSVGVLGLLALVPAVVVSLPKGRRAAAFAFGAGFLAPVSAVAVWALLAGVGPALVADVWSFPLAHRADIVASAAPRASVGALAAVVVLALGSAVAVIPTLESALARAVRGRGAWIALGGAAVLAAALAVHPPRGSLDETLAGAGLGLALYGLPPLAAAAGALAFSARRDRMIAASSLGVAGVAATMFIEAGGALDWSHLIYVIPAAAVLGAWVLEHAGVARVAVGVTVASVLALGALGIAYPSISELAHGGLVPLGGGYRGILVGRDEAAGLQRIAQRIRLVPPSAPVLVYPVDAGLYVLSERHYGGRHAQFVHALTRTEQDGEAALLRESPPALVVVREAGSGIVPYARWSGYGKDVLAAALVGKRPVLESAGFVVYGGPL